MTSQTDVNNGEKEEGGAALNGFAGVGRLVGRKCYQLLTRFHFAERRGRRHVGVQTVKNSVHPPMV